MQTDMVRDYFHEYISTFRNRIDLDSGRITRAVQSATRVPKIDRLRNMKTSQGQQWSSTIYFTFDNNRIKRIHSLYFTTKLSVSIKFSGENNFLNPCHCFWHPIESIPHYRELLCIHQKNIES
jgi:hypothetical protein